MQVPDPRPAITAIVLLTPTCTNQFLVDKQIPGTTRAWYQLPGIIISVAIRQCHDLQH